MSASISMKQKNVGMDFLKQTAGILTGATGAYISEVMPVTTSTLSEAKSTVSAVSSAFINTTQSILPKMRQLKTQTSFRSITNWFMEKEDDFDGMGGMDAQLDFDIDTESATIAEAQITEFGKGANQISQAVVESSHKMVESQLAATANLMATAEKQTAVITAGFDKTNETLNKILEVLTKNTSTLIETTVANNSKRSANDEMVSNGKFNLSDYKKIVAGNFKNSQFGMMASMVPALLGDPAMIKQMLTPTSIVQMVMGGALNKAAPNLKKNMAALDKAISDTVMTSLIRLGENDSFGFKGQLARMFGIDSSRKNANTSRSSLELKTVPFDSIAHESITNAIPGYLRKILVAVGGEDVIYDYRSRSFRTKSAIHKDFRDMASTKGSLYGASDKVRGSLGTSQFSNMIYDMMMTDLGSRTSGGHARQTVEKFSNRGQTESYILDTVLKGLSLSPQEVEAARKFAAGLGKASSGTGAIDIMNQVGRNNVNRNMRTSQYVDTANAFNVDLSDIRDSVKADMKNIAESYGKQLSSDSSVRPSKLGNLTGVNYTNMALYEIYRKLNDGINVYQVGKDRSRREKFKSTLDNLPAPQAYKPKPMGNLAGAMVNNAIGSSLTSDYSDQENLLKNQQLEDGSTENLTGGQRFARWGKNRGGNLARAMFSGSPEQVTDAIGLMIRDVGQVAGDGIKKGAAKINESSGNFAGYLKHKITGAGYKYIDDDGKEVEIEKNDKGGVLGYFNELIFGEGGAKGLMKKIGSSGSKWFKSVAGYFNYGGNDPDEQKVVGKRKRLLGTSVGAMLGMGMLGGPLGIIMGGIAGSAMAQTDGLGGKIKNILFGDKDHQGDKRKDRNKRRGLIGRAVDGIVDPIRYQIGKTMTTFGSVLKKNILGPLSNIGYAIKERMSNAAGGVVSKVFGGIFKGAAGMLKKMILLPLNIARAPISMLGMGARGAAEGGGVIAGSFLNSIAGAIGGKNAKAGLKDRIKSQKNDAKIDKAESGFFGGYEFDYVQDPNGPRGKMMKVAKKTSKGRDYKTWKAKEDERRDKMGGIDEYTKDSIKDTAESTSEISKDMKDMKDAVTGEIIPGSSFKSHDAGVHDRLDKILDVLTGGKIGIGSTGGIKEDATVPGLDKLSATIKQSSVDNERDSFSTGAIAAAAQLAATGDDVTNKEASLTTEIIDNAAKPNSNKSTIAQKLKDLMGIQKKKLEDATEKKETIFDKIFNFLGKAGDTLKSLIPMGAVIAALYALFKSGGLKDLLDRLGTGVEKFLGLFGGENKDGEDATTVGMNVVSSIADIQVKDKSAYANPFANLYHNNEDPAGNRIVNSSATEAKNELLWKMNARKDIIGPTWNTLRASSKLNTADRLYSAADAQRAQGGLWNKTKAKFNEIRGDRALQQSLDAEEAAKAPRTSTIKGIARAAGRIGVIDFTGRAAGGIASNIASGLGADEETSATVGRVTNAATSGALTVNAVKSTLKPGKKAWVDKILDGIVAMFKFIGEKVGADKAVRAIGSTKVVSTITSSAKQITGAIASKFDDLIIDKIAAKLSALGIKNAATVATAGVAIAAGAVVGLASGFCGTEHLFGVLPGDADAGMRTISSLFGAAFGALEWTPAGWIVAILDVIDAILVAIPGIGVGIKQFLARKVYELFGGGAKLAEKQAAFQAEKEWTEKTYGVSYNNATFNDEINNTGLLDTMWHGGTKYGDDGHIRRDKAGAVIHDGGIKGLFVGGEKKYVTDSNGAVIKDSGGNAIQALDKHGNKLKEDKKWGDHVGDFFGGIGRWFAGGTEYETDENGQAIYDSETGEFKVKEKQGNIFQRAGSAISDWWGGKEVMGPDGKMTKTEGFADAAKKTLGNIGSAIAKPFQDAGAGIANWWGGEYELDANGEPLKDENGNPIRKGGFKDWAVKGIGKITETAGNVVKGISSTASEWIFGEYERDGDGNPLLDDNNQPIRKGGLAGWIKGGLGKLNETFVEPAKDMIKGATDWISNKATWVMEKAGTAGNWIADKASSLWKTISDPVKDAFNGAKDWVTNKADWLGEKAKSAGAWISEKAGAAWKFISDPVKDAVAGASEWVSKKAAWISDKAKDAKDWIVENTGKLFGSITDNVKGLVDGAQKWVTEKADWVKDGVKDVGEWIGDKAKSVWDWITGGINKIADKGEQAKHDEEYIKSQQNGTGGSRGVGGARIRGIGGGSAAETLVNNTVDTAFKAVQAAKNSENKDANTVDSGSLPSPFIGSQFQFSVPSAKEDCDYGPRTLRGAPDFHTGIDLAPTGGDGSIGAVSEATVTRVSNDVKSTKGGSGYGNFVEYQLPNGIKILNGHMSPNTIPNEIKPGATLKPGDKIGKWGTTGNSTGNHLHFEARKDDISDGHGGHSFDPAPLLGMGTVSDTGSYSSPSPGSLPDLGLSSTSADSGIDSAAGPLAQLLSTLKNAGSEFMNKISGGLFGNTNSSDSSSGSSADGSSSYGDYGSYSGTCASAADFLRLCAAEIGNTENPPNSNKTKYGKWYGLDGNAWCMMFVQWCFNQAGLTLEHKSASCYETRDWWQSHHPDRVFKQTAKPGDIVIFNFSHTGIVESDNGSTVTTIEGNTSPDDSGSQSNGGCVARKKRDKSRCSVFIRPVDFEKLSIAATSSSSISGSSGEPGVWQFLKSAGYSDTAAAGIMGCWDKESGNKSDTVEGYYLKNYPGYDRVMSSQSALDSYTTGVLFPAYQKSGLSINRAGYKGNDQHYYPGIGLAQWTGPRGYDLFNFAKSRGLDWRDAKTQFQFFNQEMQSRGLAGPMNSQTNPSSAAEYFCRKYEGYNGKSGIAERQTSANRIFSKYKGTGAPSVQMADASMPSPTEGETGVGGETSQNLTAIAKITPSNFTKKIAQSASNAATSFRSSFTTSSAAKRITPPADEGVYNDNIITADTPIERIEKLLIQVVAELAAIEGNTGTSSNLLNDLNGKDFVDKGLRDSLSNVGKNQKKSHVGRHVQQNNNNSRTIAAMARP